MKFRSINKYHQMPMPPLEVREIINGVATLTQKPRLPIEFVGYTYTTEDPEKIAVIKAHALFGIEIKEDVDAPVEKKEGGEPELVEAPTVNKMIEALTVGKGADPSQFKGLKKEDLAAMALEKFNVKFI